MFLKVFLSWFRNFLMAVGGSLLAAGLVGFVTPDTAPFPMVFTLVTGLVMVMLSLILSVLRLIPGSPKGD